MALMWSHRLGLILITIIGLTTLLYHASFQIPFVHLVRLRVGNAGLGAVASENKLCTQIGIDLIKTGGNAADAVVGTTLCVGVTNMYHSGIGGGGLALVKAPNGTYESIDFRETAPAAANVDMFKDNYEASLRGGLASGVPGQLRGLECIHTRYGRLSWSQVVRPAIDLARNGFEVSEDLVHAMGIPKAHDRRRAPKFGGDNSFLTDEPAWAIDFAPHQTRLVLGDTMTRKRYADTLEEIANTGVDSFYSGKLATQTVATLRVTNGTMTVSDMADYKALVREPVEIDFHGYRILGCGVPASGAVTLSILKTMEGYEDIVLPEMKNLSTHRLVEAMRFGYGKRANFGDADFLDNFHEYENGILNDSYAASVRGRILDDRTQNVSAYDPNGFEGRHSHGTSQISAADSSGLAISLTTSINLFFGSHVIIPESGVIMNNQMNDFSIPSHPNQFGYRPSPANYIAPRKRPLSSMSPIIASSKSTPNEVAVFGSAGGSRIITAVAQIVLNLLVHNFSTYTSVKEARVHDQLLPNILAAEWEYDNATVDAMMEKYHVIERVPPGYSSAHVVRRLQSGAFEAVAEVRQAGSSGMVV